MAVPNDPEPNTQIFVLLLIASVRAFDESYIEVSRVISFHSSQKHPLFFQFENALKSSYSRCVLYSQNKHDVFRRRRRQKGARKRKKCTASISRRDVASGGANRVERTATQHRNIIAGTKAFVVSLDSRSFAKIPLTTYFPIIIIQRCTNAPLRAR